MVMGPTHAMSGAAFALTASAFGATVFSFADMPLPVVILWTIVCAGAALAPDIDSYTSTVVNSFGVLGRLGHNLANGISLTVHETTRTKYDKPKNNGHRTFFHTIAMGVIVGLLVSAGSSLPGTVTILDKNFATGQLFSVFVMGLFLHLALAGLFEKQIKKARKKYGPYILMGTSALTAVGIAYLLPEDENYSWLGMAVAAGWIIHLLGDMITKMGVPLAWPLKIRGKRWYDVTLPVFLRISAGGAFEKAVLLPVLTFITAVALMWHIPGVSHVATNIIEWFGGLFT